MYRFLRDKGFPFLITTGWYGGAVGSHFPSSEAREADGPVNVYSEEPFRIGVMQRKGAGAFRGVIDDVRVYDRALTPEEIETRSRGEAGIRSQESEARSQNEMADADR